MVWYSIVKHKSCSSVAHSAPPGLPASTEAPGCATGAVVANKATLTLKKNFPMRKQCLQM